MDPYTTLLAIQTNLLSQLQTITTSPKPDYGIGGQSVSWSAHFSNLMKALQDINNRIAEATPSEIHSTSI